MNNMNFDIMVFLHRSLVPKLLCVFWGAMLIFLLVHVKLTLWPTEAQDITILSTTQTESNVQQSLTIPLFGDYVSLNTAGGGIKQSTLPVDIIGIMYSSNKIHSQVLIRLNNGEEHSYMLGDELPGGGLIKQIKVDKVVILYQGALEELYLPKNKLQFDEPAKPLELIN